MINLVYCSKCGRILVEEIAALQVQLGAAEERTMRLLAFGVSDSWYEENIYPRLGGRVVRLPDSEHRREVLVAIDDALKPQPTPADATEAE